MRRGLLEWTVRLVAAIVALAITATALYVQLFEVRARQEESRLAALRLENALAESRSRLKAEIVAELRAELAKGGAPATESRKPIPGTVLRRPEPDESTGPALEPTLPAPPLTLSGLARGLAALSQQTKEADRLLRRDLQEFRAATRLELDADAKATTLTLVALIFLAVYLLLSLWQDRPREEDANAAAR